MSLLPIFLKLDGRPGLLVGAGTVALDKIGSLRKTGIHLRVVAPRAHEEIRQLANEGKLEWIERSFESSDLDGNFLVIAATDNPEVNAAVYRGAVERNIICNSVDDIPNCDFFFGSVVSRGDLQIAISTAGESPAFAQRLRREIDEQLPADLGPWLTNLGQLRREILATHPRSEERKLLLHELAHRQICDSPTCSTRQLAHSSEASSNKQTVIQSEVGRNASNEIEGPAVGKIAQTGKVYLVGAGPGDPDLLTVKALRFIQSADVILHDDLVPQPILDLAAPSAEIVNVGKRCGAKTITQDEIHALMIGHARAQRSVVRLKSGDPLIFGRAAEEIAALAAAEVLFEVVPGITAAFAAAAAVGCSLTSRDAASNVIFSTGHHAASHNSASIPEIENATRVVYMPGRDLKLLALEWLDEGLPPDFPCAIVSRAGQPGRQIRCTTLAALGDAEPIPAPSLLIAGWAIRESAAIQQSVADGASVKA
jgi:uroporphyrin-III C-methyltransferase / precorrin-2 dehydrogenase / sirohydrochlorin ferrochelatase